VPAMQVAWKYSEFHAEEPFETELKLPELVVSDTMTLI
jgi:hypothetical protein